MKLSIIIVSWNVKAELLECLRSIYANRPSETFEIILVDNASKDGTVEAARQQYPDITLLANQQNKGFAAANNQGIKTAKGQYILLLNPDTIIHPGSLDKLLEFMDANPRAGACGPKLLNSDNTVQRSVRKYPTFRAMLYRHSVFKLLGLFKNHYRQWRMKDFAYEKQTNIEQLMGAALMVRAETIDQVGLLDEDFFIYYEEVDWCRRINQAGWQVVFVPQAVITHLGGASSVQIPAANRFIMLSSMLKFFRKHKGRLKTNAFCLLFKPAVVLLDTADFLKSALVYLACAIVQNKQQAQKSKKRLQNLIEFAFKHCWNFLLS